jgi:hypothetical protein
MNRPRPVLAATIVGVVCAGALALSAQIQTPSLKDPDAKPVIAAGKKFTPPIRGEATIDIIKSPTRKEGATFVTTIQIKNTSAGPISGADRERDVVRQDEPCDSRWQGSHQWSATAW